MGELKILLSAGLDRMSLLREIPLEDSSSSCQIHSPWLYLQPICQQSELNSHFVLRADE